MGSIKRIWLVNKYAMPPQYESRLRTIKFAHYLQEMGYEVLIWGSSVMHNMNIDLIEDGSLYIRRQYDDLNFIHVKSSKYKKTAGFNRVLSDIQFHYRLVKIAKKMEKPDLVVATTFALISNPVLNYCKKHKIKYITEMLDVWPDEFVYYGLISAKNPLVRYLYKVARNNYEKSDAVTFSFKGGIDYLKDKRWDKEHGGKVDMSRVFYINNGVDLNDFNKWKSEYVIDDPDLQSEKKRIVYLGSIRMVNNVLQIIKAAEKLSDREDVEFLIYGDGDDRIPLEKYCNENHVKNVKFKDKWIDPKYVPFVLSHSYLNLLNYISSDFAKHGISSSKMFQYMASGRPMVCNINILYCPITENNIGVAREMADAQDYADAIKQIIDLPKVEYDAMCIRARNAAKEYDYPYLTKKMVDVIKIIEE